MKQQEEIECKVCGVLNDPKSENCKACENKLITPNEKEEKLNIEENKESIQGLYYVKNFLSEEESINLLKVIDQQKWLDVINRRVQHYGYIYDYKRRNVSEKIGEIPDWCNFILDMLKENKLISKIPNQLIINEYNPGQGISAHSDAKVFDDNIVSISLGSVYVMKFKKGDITKEIVLEPKSAIVLSGDSRYKWTHSIDMKKFDMINGVKVLRGRRVSLTFRRIN